MIVTLSGGPLGGEQVETDMSTSEKVMIPVGDNAIKVEFTVLKVKDPISQQTCSYRVEGGSAIFTGME